MLLWCLAAAAGFVALIINHAFSLTVTLWGIAGFGLMVLAFAVFGVHLSQMTEAELEWSLREPIRARLGRAVKERSRGKTVSLRKLTR